MQNNNRTKRFLSILLSALMVFTALPLMAFTSVAAETSAVISSGDWLQPAASWNSSKNGFSNNGAGVDYATSGLHDTNFIFMQTEDNQVMTYGVDFYAKKNSFVNSVKIKNINTNYNNDEGFAEALARTTELYPELRPEWWSDGGGSERFVEGPVFYSGTDDVDVGSGVKHFLYTAKFVANGSAVYSPEWEIHYRTASNSWIGYNEYKTSALNYNGETTNWNPVFTITVVDLREVNTLIDLANDVGLDVTDITGNRDFSGNTYYSQSEVDGVVAQLRQALLCDYSELDAQLARAAAIEPVNVEGGLGGKLYDDDLYDAFTSAYAAAQAVDRFLMEDVDGVNDATIASAAAALKDAIDNLIPTRKALVSYYVDGELYAQNTVDLTDPAKTYNFHDSTDKFITSPTKEGYDFIGWKASDGTYIEEDFVITEDLSVYADFYVALNGTRPLSSDGRWDHVPSASESDGRGENYITMWVKDINFNFVQVADNQTFSFYTDFTAYKNEGSNSVQITGVYLVNDTETNTFSNLVEGDIGVSCITGNAADTPEEQGEMPGIFMNNHASQRSSYFATWRYIYDFRADGAATYHPKWNINYNAGWTGVTGTTSYDLTDSGDTYVNFTINVTDIRELNNLIDKAESIYNNRNSNFSQDDLDALRSILDYVKNNYTLDGSVYYEQSVIDGLVDQIKLIIPDELVVPCDYTDLDEAIATAQAKQAEYDNNSDGHFIHEVWDDFIDAYNAATAIDRNLTVDDANQNQKLIDNAAYRLNMAIKALTYETHVNQPCDYEDITPIVEDAINTIGTENDGRYDDDAWQDYIDALEDAQDVIDNNLYDDEDGTNQQAIDDAKQALEDAIAALNDPANQNGLVDTTALENAVDRAETENPTNDNNKYKEDAWNEYQEALAEAQDILDNPPYDDDKGVNQQATDDAAQRLQDALDALNDPANQNNACDYSALDEAITAAQSINNSDLFTPETYQALQDALTAGQEVDRNLYDIGTNQQIIDDAAQAINDALANLLADVIDNAGDVDTTGMTDVSIQNLTDALDNAQTVAGDNTSTSEDKATAINDIVSAAEGLTVDKSELEQTINAAEAIDTTNIPQDLVDALEDAITNGQTVDEDDDATVAEIQEAIDAINDAIDNILQNAIDEANNTDTTGMTDESVQALEDVIQNAEDVLNDPESTPQDKVDAIEALEDAINDLAEVTQLIPTTDGGLIVDRTDTKCYYLVGLNASDTTFASVKNLFKNDGRQIIAFRGETQLTESDHIGTGCIIKCVSIEDPTIVYEQATVILYGDVNGDGFINDTDYDALFNETLFNVAVEGELFRIAGDLNNDGVIDGFDMSILELQMTGARIFDQTVEFYK